MFREESHNVGQSVGPLVSQSVSRSVICARLTEAILANGQLPYDAGSQFTNFFQFELGSLR